MLYRGHAIEFKDGGYTYAAANGVTFETADEAMQDIDQFVVSEPTDDILTKYGPHGEIPGAGYKAPKTTQPRKGPIRCR